MGTAAIIVCGLVGALLCTHLLIYWWGYNRGEKRGKGMAPRRNGAS